MGYNPSDDLDDDDKNKLQGYSNYLDTNDPTQNAKDYLAKLQADNSRAVGIAARGPLETTTPEENDFADKQLGPLGRGLIGGGAMGSIEKVGVNAAEDAAQSVKPAFQRLQQMMKVGNVTAPVENTAQALKIKDALEQTGQVLPNRFGQVIRKY